MNKKRAFALYLVIPSVLLIILETFPIVYSEDAVLDPLLKVIATRAVGCAVFIPDPRRSAPRASCFARAFPLVPDFSGCR